MDPWTSEWLGAGAALAEDPFAGADSVRTAGAEDQGTTARQRRFEKKKKKRSKQPGSTGDLTRYELKYLLHPAQVPLLRAFIQPWCAPDSHGLGDPPSYVNTTLLFDTPDRACYRSRCTNALTRFKLRARVYATDGSAPVVIEIKRKLGHSIIKSRAKIPFDRFGPGIFQRIDDSLEFRKDEERQAYREFARLVQETGAAPVVLLRYRREPWFGTVDDYARVTFDSQMSYQPCRSWDGWGRGGRWRPFDNALWPEYFSGTVMELKCGSLVPCWMQEAIARFELQRRAFCKYALAIEAERGVLPESLRDEWDL